MKYLILIKRFVGMITFKFEMSWPLKENNLAANVCACLYIAHENKMLFNEPRRELEALLYLSNKFDHLNIPYK